MAVHNPSALYTGGAERFNSQPEVNMYANLLAKRQAKNEALNQFFDKELRDLSPVGVREVHKPGLLKEIDDAKNFWYGNKERIMKGGQERLEFEKKFQNAAYNIQKAKARDKFLLELGKARAEGKYDPDDDDLKVLDKVSRSIYDPQSYKQDGVSDFDWSDISASVPDFDADRQNKLWMAATKGLTPGKEYDYTKKRVNPSTRQEVVPFQKKFSEGQVEQIASETSSLVKEDKAARKYYNKILDDPRSEGFEKLQTAYSKYFKGIVDTPEKAAAADAIIRASIPQEVGEEQELQRNAPVIKNYVGGGSKGGGTTGLSINDVYTRIREALGDKGAMPANELDSDLVSFLAAESKKDPANIVVGVEGDRLAYYEVLDEGKNRRIGYLTPISVNVKTQPSVREKREVIKQGNTQQPSSNRKPTYQGLDKNGNPIFK